MHGHLSLNHNTPMLTLTLSWVLLALSSGALGDQEPLSGYGSNNLNALTVQDMFAADQYLGGFGPRAWSAERYVGLTTFGHAQPARCWGSEKDAKFDIAIVGGFPISAIRMSVVTHQVMH